MLRHLRNYLPYLRPERGRIAFAIGLALVGGIAGGFGIPFFLEKVFKPVFSEGTRGEVSEILLLAALLPAVFLVRGLATFLSQFHMHIAMLRTLKHVRADVFEHLQRLPLADWEGQHSSDYLSRIITDANQVQSALTALARDGTRHPFTALGALGYLGYLAVQQQESVFLVVMLVAVLLMIVLPVQRIGRHLRRLGRRVQEAQASVTERLTEALRGQVEVRLFNLEELQQRQFDAAMEDQVEVMTRTARYERISQPLVELIAAIAIAAAFVYAHTSGLDAAVFTAMATALYLAGDAFKRLVRMLNTLQRSQGAFERLDELKVEPETLREPEQPRAPEVVRGAITFREVTFAYRDRPVFEGLGVAIEPGQVVALVGPSGAGKSTFSKLVPRLYDVQAGAVEIDGLDVRAWSLRHLRAQMAIVPQSPILFSGTVAENIRLGRADASDAEVEDACRRAYAHEFIAALPQGYAASVGENAGKLSGGQRQRLALARAFLKNAPILILDEATSALDSESEERIQDALRLLVQGKTVLMIAHRFSTLKLCQRILVFEGGRIVGDGPHETLLETCGLYRQLYEHQRAGPEAPA